MSSSIKKHILNLLQPACGTAGWHAAISELDEQKAVPVLLDIVTDTGIHIAMRRTAVSLLGTLSQEAVVMDTLKRILFGDEERLRGRAALALGAMDRKKEVASRLLIDCLRDQNAFVRECAARSLGALGSMQAVAVLQQMKEADPDETNRKTAALVLNQIKDGVR